MFRNNMTKNMSSYLFKSLWRQNICTKFTEIGESGQQNLNQAIDWWWAWQLLFIDSEIICCKKGEWKYNLLFIQEKPMFIKKCCWHCVIGSKAKCNYPLTWWGLWCGLSIGLKFDLWSSPCIWRCLASEKSQRLISFCFDLRENKAAAMRQKSLKLSQCQSGECKDLGLR